MPPRTSWAAEHALADRAARYGTAHGLRSAVAVLDTTTGAVVAAGDRGPFATASVVKTMIAARLLAEGRLTGPERAAAYTMITRSDDAIANRLWGAAGGPGLEPWTAGHYGIADLGSPNTRPGYWGNTHVTAAGLARFYAAAKTDPQVGPWLLDAMTHTAPVAADGTRQFFGIASAASSFAVKQGWADGSADTPGDSIVNSTGFVGAGRYVVVILTEGHGNNGAADGRGFNAPQARVVTAMARILLPGGRPAH